MTSWVKADHNFNDHFAVFAISAKENAVYRLLLDKLLGGMLDKPVEAEAALYDLIVTERPELAGCCIYSFTFNNKLMCWEIGLTHNSLPPTRLYQECRAEWLKR